MPIGTANPFAFSAAWDVVRVAGQNAPGLARVDDAEREYEWDVKKGKGASGATITFVQKPPPEVVIVFVAWEIAHFLAWDTFLPTIKLDPTKLPTKGLDIYHPALDDLDIKAVVTKKIGGWKHLGEGLFERRVTFLEYAPPPPVSAVATPNGAAGDSTDGGSDASAQDADQQQIAQLFQQASAPL